MSIDVVTLAIAKKYANKIREEIGVRLTCKVVTTLPIIGESSTIYLIQAYEEDQNIYDEYLYIDGSWEKIGSTAIDLSDYLTKTDAANTYLKNTSGSINRLKIVEKLSFDDEESSRVSLQSGAARIGDDEESSYPYLTLTNIPLLGITEDPNGDPTSAVNLQMLERTNTTVSNLNTKVNQHTSSINTMQQTISNLVNEYQDITDEYLEVEDEYSNNPMLFLLDVYQDIQGKYLIDANETLYYYTCTQGPSAALQTLMIYYDDSTITYHEFVNGQRIFSKDLDPSKIYFTLFTSTGSISFYNAGQNTENKNILSFNNPDVEIRNVAKPLTDTSAANKKYVDDAIAAALANLGIAEEGVY